MLKNSSKKFLILTTILIGALFIMSDPVYGICEDYDDSAESMQNIFMILQGIGAVLAVVLSTFLTVLDSMIPDSKKNYGEWRNKTLISGLIIFIIPPAGEVILGQLSDADLGCFFP